MPSFRLLRMSIGSILDRLLRAFRIGIWHFSSTVSLFRLAMNIPPKTEGAQCVLNGIFRVATICQRSQMCESRQCRPRDNTQVERGIRERAHPVLAQPVHFTE